MIFTLCINDKSSLSRSIKSNHNNKYTQNVVEAPTNKFLNTKSTSHGAPVSINTPYTVQRYYLNISVKFKLRT